MLAFLKLTQAVLQLLTLAASSSPSFLTFEVLVNRLCATHQLDMYAQSSMRA